jgi:hypothetical protein
MEIAAFGAILKWPGRVRSDSTANSGVIVKRIIFGAALFGLAASAALSLASPASAAPLGGAAADQVVQTLTARGYTVQINGAQDAPLDRCTVTDVDGLTGATPGSTVYVDINCPSDYR